MNMINNPVLRGFNPDPSILRVEDDYYIATSTFEWFPGIQIHHSKDLIHWELLTRPLCRTSQLDLRGITASHGVWAPALTYENGTYYLVYAVVRSFLSLMYDTQNYLVTTTDICGEWSDPILLNSYGFDPSLFHDDDGRKYLVSMISDHRPGRDKFGGIILQEYSPEQKKMVGKAKKIFTRPGQLVEGPHLIKRNGYYYLFLADGGTGEWHGESVARSHSLWGGYEWYEQNPFLTARHNPNHPLQKTGHSDLVQTQSGEWYLCHLCGRPLESRAKNGEHCYTLGRETAIQKVRWTEDGWIQLVNGTTLADVEVPAPNLPKYSFLPEPVRDDFDSTKLNINFQSLRIPIDESWCSLNVRPGWLRLYGAEGVNSTYCQSLLARRWQSFRFRAETYVDFHPECYKQMAGLICLYDQENFYYLHVTWDEEQGQCLNLISGVNNQYKMLACVAIPDTPVYLKVEVDHDKMQFFYSNDGRVYEKVGPVNDASTLSDEACRVGWFTGAFVGLCCQDLTGCSQKEADFDWFDYQEMTES